MTGVDTSDAGDRVGDRRVEAEVALDEHRSDLLDEARDLVDGARRVHGEHHRAEAGEARAR